MSGVAQKRWQQPPYRRMYSYQYCLVIRAHIKSAMAPNWMLSVQCTMCFQGMNIAKDGWYTELGSMWPGQGLSLKVKEVLHQGRSKFQVIGLHVSC